MATQEIPLYKPLETNEKADVCIVGAGIAGLTTAYLLTQKGKSVIVLDDGPIISGETRRTTAHITNALDDRYFEAIRIHGKERATLVAESYNAAIDLIAKIVADEQIDCDFAYLPGYLFLDPKTDPPYLKKELDASHAVGLTDVRILPETPIEGVKGPCLLFPKQAQFHPLKYLTQLAACITKNGGQIHAFSKVSEIEEKEPPFAIHTENGSTVHAAHLVVTTNAPINDNAVVYSKQAPYRTFVIGMDIPKDSIEKALYWDTMDPYHYVRLQKNEEDPTTDILIVGGEDHRSGEENDGDARHATLEQWTRLHFPAVKTVQYKWSGQVMETIDGLAMIGRKPGGHEQSYIATGDSGQGMTHGTIAGMLLTDLICGYENAWEDVYNPKRIRPLATGEFLKENMGTVKNLSEDYLLPGEVKNLEEIRKGEGGIMRKGITKIALYRDEEGTLFARTAVCPHKGCMIRWNSAEKSWDCPCHGSRFNAFGAVLNGPTIKDLPVANA